jgi:uncharacterized protein
MTAATLPAGHGLAVRVPAGRTLRVVNTHGAQVVDFWALAAADPTERLSVEHTRRLLGRLRIRPGDTLSSNRRNVLFELVADTSPGDHDTLCAACDPWLYRYLGAPEGHRSCAQNFAEALAAVGLDAPPAPQPLNLFMRVPVDGDGGMTVETSRARPGDAVELRALVDLVAVLSSCPMDIVPISGEAAVRDCGVELV